MVLYYLGFLPGIYTPTLLLGGTNQYKAQKDDLVGREGVITIRLTNQNAVDKGVFWSLPLSHAKYHGNPITVKHYAGVKQSQVTFENFVFVVLGSVTRSWKSPLVDTSILFQLICMLAAALKSWTLKHFALYGGSHFQARLEWLLCLGAAAKGYFQATGLELQLINRLISFGQKRWSHDLRFFGLADFVSLACTFNEPRGLSQTPVNGQVESPMPVKFLSNWADRELEPEVTGRIAITYCGSTSTTLERRTVHCKKRQKVPDIGQATQLYHWGNPPKRYQALGKSIDDIDQVSPDGRAMIARALEKIGNLSDFSAGTQILRPSSCQRICSSWSLTLTRSSRITWMSHSSFDA
jgi:hypothetical protein